VHLYDRLLRHVGPGSPAKLSLARRVGKQSGLLRFTQPGTIDCLHERRKDRSCGDIHCSQYETEKICLFQVSNVDEKLGLVVITLERYMKIDYSVAYRKYWKSPLAVVVPWISGFCTFVIPALVSTRTVPGRCPRLGYWPNKYDMMVSVQDILNYCGLCIVYTSFDTELNFIFCTLIKLN